MLAKFEKAMLHKASTFTTTRSASIHDPQLGFFYNLIRLIILLYFLLDIFGALPGGASGVYYSEIPDAYAMFWASKKDFHDEQIKTWDYCSDSTYNWADSQCQKERDAGFGIFCEMGTTCANYAFSEVNIKGESEMFFMTINKDVSTEFAACSDDVFKAACNDGDTPSSRYGYGSHDMSCQTSECLKQRYNPTDLESASMYVDNGGGQCSCVSMTNYLAKGVEGMGMTFAHRYTVTNQFKPQCQSHNKVVTYLHRGGVDNVDDTGALISDPRKWKKSSCTSDEAGFDAKECKFKDGSVVSMRIDEWLKMAGLKDGLDERNKKGMTREPMADWMQLPYRITGLEIQMDMNYVGYISMDEMCTEKEFDSDDPPVELHVLVKGDGGWHSKGSQVAMSPTYPTTSNGIRTGHIHDQYKRGIKFSESLRVSSQLLRFIACPSLVLNYS